MGLSNKYYKALAYNTIDEHGKIVPANIYHFCCIDEKGGKAFVFPVGYCRKNKKDGNNKCDHRTPQEANNCYRNYELNFEVFVGALPEDEEADCIECRKAILPTKNVYKDENGKECVSYAKTVVVVGVRQFRLNLCNNCRTRAIIEKHYPHYEVIN